MKNHDQDQTTIESIESKDAVLTFFLHRFMITRRRIKRDMLMKKLFLSLSLVLFSIIVMPVFSQKLTLDDAINDYAMGLATSIQKNSAVAVIAFETDSVDLMVYFIDTMVDKLFEKGVRSIVERRRLDVLQQELDYSLSGNVSDKTAVSVGQMVGANTVIYGSFRRMGDIDCQAVIRATNVETGELIFPKTYDLKMDTRLRGLLGMNTKFAQLWSLGASVGTSFTNPWLITTVRGTLAPFTYSFFDIGVDVGFINNTEGITGHYSLCPFVRYAFFLPFEKKGGWYIGAGASYFVREYRVDDWTDSRRYWTADITTGVNIGNILDISYTFRTNFTSAMNKVSVGYTYRFKQRSGK